MRSTNTRATRGEIVTTNEAASVAQVARGPARAADRIRHRALLSAALIALRVGTATLFMAHALVRVLKPGSIQQFGKALENIGLPQGVALVWTITVFELGAGLLMALGYRSRYMAAGFGGILVGGIILIHRHLGWFVGEHGSGGSEYSVALLLALLVIACADLDGADRLGPSRQAG